VARRFARKQSEIILRRRFDHDRRLASPVPASTGMFAV
jgi:hypothetical protein